MLLSATMAKADHDVVGQTVFVKSSCDNPVDLFTIFTQPDVDSSWKASQKLILSGLCHQMPFRVPMELTKLSIEDFPVLQDEDVRGSIWEAEQDFLDVKKQYILIIS